MRKKIEKGGIKRDGEKQMGVKVTATTRARGW
jgi:hypothetical protein